MKGKQKYFRKIAKERKIRWKEKNRTRRREKNDEKE